MAKECESDERGEIGGGRSCSKTGEGAGEEGGEAGRECGEGVKEKRTKGMGVKQKG